MIWNQQRVQSKQPANQGLLLAQPKEPTTTAKIGLQPLGLDGDRDGFLNERRRTQTTLCSWRARL